MAGCCPSGDYPRFFNQRFARRLANRYRKRGLDQTAQTMVQFLQEVGIEGATVLEIGGASANFRSSCCRRGRRAPGTWSFLVGVVCIGAAGRRASKQLFPALPPHAHATVLQRARQHDAGPDP